MVTAHPLISSFSNNAGIAVISLDFSSTLRGPSTDPMDSRLHRRVGQVPDRFARPRGRRLLPSPPRPAPGPCGVIPGHQRLQRAADYEAHERGGPGCPPKPVACFHATSHPSIETASNAGGLCAIYLAKDPVVQC
jgi:hypothetical protein